MKGNILAININLTYQRRQASLEVLPFSTIRVNIGDVLSPTHLSEMQKWIIQIYTAPNT